MFIWRVWVCLTCAFVTIFVTALVIPVAQADSEVCVRALSLKGANLSDLLAGLDRFDFKLDLQTVKIELDAAGTQTRLGSDPVTHVRFLEIVPDPKAHGLFNERALLYRTDKRYSTPAYPQGPTIRIVENFEHHGEFVVGQGVLNLSSTTFFDFDFAEATLEHEHIHAEEFSDLLNGVRRIPSVINTQGIRGVEAQAPSEGYHTHASAQEMRALLEGVSKYRGTNPFTFEELAGTRHAGLELSSAFEKMAERTLGLLKEIPQEKIVAMFKQHRSFIATGLRDGNSLTIAVSSFDNFGVENVFYSYEVRKPSGAPEFILKIPIQIGEKKIDEVEGLEIGKQQLMALQALSRAYVERFEKPVDRQARLKCLEHEIESDCRFF